MGVGSSTAAGRAEGMEERLLQIPPGVGSLQEVGAYRSPSPPEPARWWVLFLYGTLSAVQSLLWISYSSVPASSQDFFATSPDTLSLWLDWGPVAFCFTVLPSLWLLHRSRAGLRVSIRLGLTLCTLSAALRLLPAWLPRAQRASALSLGVTHLAQFLNGAVAPLAVASPAYLSLVWFPDSERNLATAFANTSNALGRAVGFFLGPLLVRGADDLPTLLYVTAACVVVPCAAAWAYLPAVPAAPPSGAAALEARRWEGKGGAAAANTGGGGGDAPLSQLGLRGALAQARAACASPSFLLAAVGGGTVMAFYGGALAPRARPVPAAPSHQTHP